MYRKRKASGLCPACGKVPMPEGRTLCDGCRVRNDEYRMSFQGAGICIMCRVHMADKPSSRCKSCLERQRLRMRSVLEGYREAGLCKCGSSPEDGKKSCGKCRAIARARRERIKRKVMMAYGGMRCSYCWEDNPRLLSIDHVNNDGAAHRKALRGRHSKKYMQYNNVEMYRDIIRRGFPPGFDVLCVGCNLKKHHLGGKLPEKPKVDPFYTERDLDSM